MWLYFIPREPAYSGTDVEWSQADLEELADKSDHRIRYNEVRIWDKFGNELHAPNFHGADSVSIKFLHSKADQLGRNDEIRHKLSGCETICPVLSAVRAKMARWALYKSHKVPLVGPLSAGIKAHKIASVIESVAKSFGKNPDHYALHSIRIGAATAMFNAGFDSLVIKLAGIGDGAMDVAAKAIVSGSM